MELHKLLRRQIRRLGLAEGERAPDAAAWRGLLESISRAYAEADQDRYLLERSQEISSRELREQARALRTSEARLGSLLSLSADWVWELDRRFRFTFVSVGLQAATGLDPQRLIGHRIDRVCEVVLAPDVAERLRENLSGHRPFRNATIGARFNDERLQFLRVSGEPRFDAAGRFAGYLGVGSDVTEATEAARQADELARFDHLTGLHNRMSFRDRLHAALADGQRFGRRVAVCFIDLDRFKAVNDSLGHAAGDELLKTVARRIGTAVQQEGVTARLGGDEFVVLVEHARSVDRLREMASAIMTAIGQPTTLQGVPYELTASIGISVYPEDGQDASALLRCADAAMYRAKGQGKNQVQFYDVALAQQAQEKLRIEAELRQAIPGGELVLHFQPKVCAFGGGVSGVEALVRWLHPQRGLLMPAQFVPIAEEVGLIAALDLWVLHTACRQLRQWLDRGVQVGRCAVNVSGRHFASDSLVHHVDTALRTHGLPAQALELEITESVLMADAVHARQVLKRLCALGVRVAIDDFGTGYSSLAYLKSLPAQALKIDKSFIAGLPTDAEDCAITKAIVALAHSLSLQVVAEGVETSAQRDHLRQLGCDEFQGYLIGRPVPADELVARLSPAPSVPTPVD